MHVGDLQAGGKGGIFQALQQALIELLVDFEIALQNIVVNHALINGADVCLLLGQGVAEQLNAVDRGQIIILYFPNRLFARRINEALHVSELLMHTLGFGKVGSVLGHDISVLSFEIIVFFLQTLENLVFDNDSNLAFISLGKFVNGLLLVQVAFGNRIVPVQLLQPFIVNGPLATDIDDEILALIIDQGLLGFLHLGLEFLELLLHPSRGMTGKIAARLKVGIFVVLD